MRRGSGWKGNTLLAWLRNLLRRRRYRGSELTHGTIFISYRHDDDPGFVQALYQKLEPRFPRGSVFMDVEGSIRAGDDFRKVVEDRVRQCEVLLAVIGPRWLDAQDEHGHRRLDSGDDLMRIEIVSALDGNKRVIPVLVNDAEMPRPNDLPDDARPLSWRRAILVRHERFAADCEGLIGEVEAALENAHVKTVDPNATLVDQTDVMGDEIERLRKIIDAFTRQQRRLRILGLVVAAAGLLGGLLAHQGILGKIMGLLQTQ
jgi:hypothetical protein